MRFNLYSSSLVLASTAAMELATKSDYYDPLNTLAQVDADAEWSSNGFEPSGYRRPEDNCCVVYMGKEWTEPVSEPLCWDNSDKAAKKQGASKIYGSDKKIIRALDCGKNTWAQVLENAHYDMSKSIAGRMSSY